MHDFCSRHAPRDEPNGQTTSNARSAHHAERDGYVEETRFLGDLYQDLSEAARKKYALLQTPEFVEEFILERTLEPALEEFGLTPNQPLALASVSESGGKKTEASANGSGSWRPAAGTFDGWPKTAKELKCLDPCMGSGHFIVAMFERLVALRMAEEELDEAEAVATVIADNLFGLEIDPRCTQIAAFNLALAAWRRVGYCKLPAMNLACSGLAPNAKEEDWLALAGDDEKLQNGMEQLYALFEKAPVLGSLINPRAHEGDLLVAAFHELQPLLEKALVQ